MAGVFLALPLGRTTTATDEATGPLVFLLLFAVEQSWSELRGLPLEAMDPPCRWAFACHVSRVERLRCSEGGKPLALPRVTVESVDTS